MTWAQNLSICHRGSCPAHFTHLSLITIRWKHIIIITIAATLSVNDLCMVVRLWHLQSFSHLQIGAQFPWCPSPGRDNTKWGQVFAMQGHNISKGQFWEQSSVLSVRKSQALWSCSWIRRHSKKWVSKEWTCLREHRLKHSLQHANELLSNTLVSGPTCLKRQGQPDSCRAAVT